jgi:hypothetical protein
MESNKSIIFMSLILSLAGSLPEVVASLACLLLLLLAVDFCNYQPKWSCRFCFHFVGLTTAFFAFYKTIWVGISLASIAVEAVATFQILGKKINPVTKMLRFTRPFGLGVLAPGERKQQVNHMNDVSFIKSRSQDFFQQWQQQ